MDAALTKFLLSLPDVAVAACDNADNIVMFSPAFDKLLGEFRPANLGELMESVPVFEDASGRRMSDEERPLLRASRGEIVRDLVVTAQHTDGSVRYLRFNAAPVRDEQGEITGAITFVQDVTAEHAERLLQDELRARLITTVNHHFRTPLSIVLGNAEVLEDLGPDLPAEVQGPVEALTRGAKKLHELVRAVSELVELEAAQELDVATGDLCDQLRHAVATHQPSATDVRVRIELRGSPHVMVRGDLVLLERAVGALLRNAIQHAPPGTTVSVEAATGRGTVHVLVCDDGPGIPPADVARLLQPFETGSPDGQAGGRGLGLALAQTIAAAHGGTLRLRPHEPTGLQAELVIPAGDAEQPERVARDQSVVVRPHASP